MRPLSADSIRDRGLRPHAQSGSMAASLLRLSSSKDRLTNRGRPSKQLPAKLLSARKITHGIASHPKTSPDDTGRRCCASQSNVASERFAEGKGGGMPCAPFKALCLRMHQSLAAKAERCVRQMGRTDLESRTTPCRIRERFSARSRSERLAQHALAIPEPATSVSRHEQARQLPRDAASAVQRHCPHLAQRQLP